VQPSNERSGRSAVEGHQLVEVGAADPGLVSRAAVSSSEIRVSASSISISAVVLRTLSFSGRATVNR
jgi:hypothetical protein